MEGAWGVLVLGAPGAGKGTQGALLAQCLGGQHLSVGDLVRRAAAAGRKIPKDRHTRLAATDFTCELIGEALDPAGWPVVLDGFPRHPNQVDALGALGWNTVGAIWLHVDFPVAIERMKARGRQGEDIAQIGMRHYNHDTTKSQLQLMLKLAGVPVVELDANDPVQEVHARCVELVHKGWGQSCG